MKNIHNCMICESGSLNMLFSQKLSYPANNIKSKLLDINVVRNKILFDDILKSKGVIEFTFHQCTDCGFIFFSPRPETEDMLIKYKMVNKLGDSKIRWAAMEKQMGNPDDDKRADNIKRKISDIKTIKGLDVVDIGGAEGHNLKYFLEDNTCYIVDFEKWDTNKAKYLCEKIEDIPKKMSFDLVLYCHILEHVVDPMKDLQAIKSKLKPGGLLYLEVPFGAWREYKSTLNFLTHINFFSIGILYKIFNLLNMEVKYLRLENALTRFGYSPGIVAIIENSPSMSTFSDSYKQTIKGMNNDHIFLQLKWLLLNFKLHPIAFSRRAINRIKMNIKKRTS